VRSQDRQRRRRDHCAGTIGTGALATGSAAGASAAHGGGGSRAVHETVKVGDALQVSLPRNRFRVPRNIRRAVLLARGIGVTPILSIADDLKARTIPFELHYVLP
jgi:ferredoxin-NADP reductase